MIDVERAHDLIREQARPLPPKRMPLGESLGLTLFADVVSDVDSPPFDKTTVDGYAIDAADPADSFYVVRQIAAGDVCRQRLAAGEAIQLMTGAPIPPGANAVIKTEDCEPIDERRVAIPRSLRAPEVHILRQGAAVRRGDAVLRRGRSVDPIAVGILAEQGRDAVDVYPRVSVGILPTGDELAEPGVSLAEGQIYNSNGPMLAALVASLGGAAVDLGVGRDDAGDLRRRIERGLGCDVLLISGGVSAGVKDLAPGVLAEIGVAEVFHKIQMRPGKPLWFGAAVAESRRTLVFGLPGNPVSALATAQLFVAPAIVALGGRGYRVPVPTRCRLSKAAVHRGDRPTYHPCRRAASPADEADSSIPWVEPLPWQGSADLGALGRAEGWLALPAGDYELQAGEGAAAIWFTPSN